MYPDDTLDVSPITYRGLRDALAHIDRAPWRGALDALLWSPTDARESVFEAWGADLDFFAALELLARLGIANAADCRDDLDSWRHTPTDEELAHWRGVDAAADTEVGICDACQNGALVTHTRAGSLCAACEKGGR